MDKTYLPVIEALIFSSEEPISAEEIIGAIRSQDGQDAGISLEDIVKEVSGFNEKYDREGLPFHLLKISGGYIYATRPEYSGYLGSLSSEKTKRRLSAQALESLAIIAYKQPVTKGEVEAIRGVNSDYIINSLLEKNLISIKGRSECLGRPLLYGTTDEFLKYFGLNKITDLPKPREIEEIMKDEDFQEKKRRLLMNQLEESIENEIE